MSSVLPFWLLIAPIVLVLIDSFVAPKSTTLGGTSNRTGTTASAARA